MKYKVRQKIFSFSDSFSIKNEKDEDVLFAKAEVFTIGRKLRIYDLYNNEIVYIEQKLFRFMPEFMIYIHEKLVARVKKEITFFSPKLKIETNLGDFSAHGNIFAYDFLIKRNNEVVAKIAKEFFSWSDYYTVDINDIDNHILVLALVIVIDQIFHYE